MIRIAFAVAIAALVFTTTSGGSQAAPAAALPAGVAADAGAGHLTQVCWHHCRWHPHRCGWW